jgi:hypothetical protein
MRRILLDFIVQSVQIEKIRKKKKGHSSTAKDRTGITSVISQKPSQQGDHG